MYRRSFRCLQCHRESTFKNVFNLRSDTYTRCEHCGAEHTVKYVARTEGGTPEYVVTGLRPPPPGGDQQNAKPT